MENKLNRVQEIKARLEAATPGPWIVSGRYGLVHSEVYADKAGRAIAYVWTHKHETADGKTDNVESAEGVANAALIANAPVDLKFLVGLIDELVENRPRTLQEAQRMEGRPVWIQVLDRPDLSGWHFIVRDKELGLVAKDARGRWDGESVEGCGYDIQNGHNYSVNWLVYDRKPKEE